MNKPDCENVMGDELDREILKKAMSKWATRDRWIVEGYKATIKIQIGNDPETELKILYKYFENWMSRKTKGFFEWRDKASSYEEMRDTFVKLAANNPKFLETVKEDVEYVTLGGKTVNPDGEEIEEEGKEGQEKEEREEEDGELSSDLVDDAFDGVDDIREEETEDMKDNDKVEVEPEENNEDEGRLDKWT